jgi:hypothetical protein
VRRRARRPDQAYASVPSSWVPHKGNCSELNVATEIGGNVLFGRPYTGPLNAPIGTLSGSSETAHTVLSENLKSDGRVSPEREAHFADTWRYPSRSATRVYGSFDAWVEQHIRTGLTPDFESKANRNNWVSEFYSSFLYHANLRFRQFLNISMLIAKVKGLQPYYHKKAPPGPFSDEADYVRFLGALDEAERLCEIRRVLMLAEAGAVPPRHPTWLTPVTPEPLSGWHPEIALGNVGICAADQFWIELHYTVGDLYGRGEKMCIPTVLDGCGMYFYPAPSDNWFTAHNHVRCGFSMSLCKYCGSGIPSAPEYIKITRPIYWLQAWIDGEETVHRTQADKDGRVYLLNGQQVDVMTTRRRHADRLV